MQTNKIEQMCLNQRAILSKRNVAHEHEHVYTDHSSTSIQARTKFHSNL